MEEKKRAVVIGSGFGGLALSIRLQASGLDVTLLEKRQKIGGRAYQLKDSGYVFDMGPSLITAPHVIDSVFKAAGRRLKDYVDLVPLDPYYRVYYHDGTHLDYVGDSERMKAQMARFNSRDANRFDAFMDQVRPIFDAVIGDRLGSKPFDTLGTMIGFLPRMARLKAFLPVTTFVNRFFKDFRHRFIFSFHPLFVGGNPFFTPAIYLMIPFLEREGGVWFTRGGMYSLVEAMGRLFQELGGEIRTETEVRRIRVESGRAVGVEAEDEYFPADLVVSNADVGHTYKHLISPEHRRRWSDRKVDGLDFTMSCFLLYLGTKRQYPGLAAPHPDSVRKIQGSLEGHLRQEDPARGLQYVPPRPHPDRPQYGAGRVGEHVCPHSRGQQPERVGLEFHQGGLRGPDPHLPRGVGDGRVEGKPRGPPHLHAR